MKRDSVTSILVVIVLLAAAITAQAQQSRKMPRIGILRIGSPPDPLIGDFRDELSKLGYSESQNIAIEYRYTQRQEQLRDLAADLVRQRVDVIVAPGGTAARIAKETTKTIPIVI